VTNVRSPSRSPAVHHADQADRPDPAPLTWRPNLFDVGRVAVDADFRHLARTELAEGAWVDRQPGWLSGAADLFERLLGTLDWDCPVVTMYGRRVDQPRLSARWSSEIADPIADAVVEQARQALQERYGVALPSIGANLYRDGHDSVAWHGDRVARELDHAVVAIVSLGEPRPFRLRPRGGGASLSWELGHGDLLVMGGTCQRTWQHSVPKVHRAGPRLSVTFRQWYLDQPDGRAAEST
jgi:alkylated DNA repair dioxygenase AlkB